MTQVTDDNGEPIDLAGYVIVEVRHDEIVIKRPWPFLPFGTDPKKALAEDKRRWRVLFDDEVFTVHEIHYP